MGKVVLFPSGTDPIAFVKDALEGMVDCDEGYEPEKVVFVIKAKNGEWATGYCNIDFSDRAEAIAHLQVDLIDQMILSNAERYGLHDHD